MQLGVLESAGLPNDAANREVEKIRAVTSDQVRQVAQKYFVDDNLTVGTLDPQPLPRQSKASPAAAGRKH
jgi:zinc protease